MFQTLTNDLKTISIAGLTNNLGENNSITIQVPGKKTPKTLFATSKTTLVGTPFPLTLGGIKSPNSLEVISNLMTGTYKLKIWYSVGKVNTSIDYYLYLTGGVPIASTALSWKNGTYSGYASASLSIKQTTGGGFLIVGTMDVDD